MLTGCGRKLGPYDCCTVVCGDCLELMKALPAGCVDAVITDPLYGLSGSYGTINTLRAKSVYSGNFKDDLNAVRTVFVPAVVQALAVCSGRGAVTPGTPHSFEYPKPDDIAAIIQPAVHRMSKWGRPTWQPVLLYGRDPRAGLTIQPLTFTNIETEPANGHPCPKPLRVMRWLVERVTLENETIPDPFMGSGTTAVAAKKLGRHFLGFEISEEYCRIARERIALVEAQPNLFEPKAEQLNLVERNG